MALAQPADVGAGVVRKGAIMGALTLYLDFINLFLMLLRILGDRRYISLCDIDLRRLGRIYDSSY